MKWALFAKYYFDPKSKTFNNAEQSAIRAGFAESYAKNITTRVGLDKVRQGLAGALDRLGVNDDYLAGKIKTLLDAKVKVRVKQKGTLLTEIESEDAFAIDKGIKHSIEIRGDKAPDKHDINASDELLEALGKMREVITVRPAGGK